MQAVVTTMQSKLRNITELFYLEKATSTDGASNEATGSKISRRTFDFTCQGDQAELTRWCGQQFEETISRGLRLHNTPFYHDCCFCFSRKGYTRKCEHSQFNFRAAKTFAGVIIGEFINSGGATHFSLLLSVPHQNL